MKLLEMLKQREDVVIAIMMVSIIGVMLLPMPPFLLDMLLTLSISLSITILITSIYIKKPLDFKSREAFPIFQAIFAATQT